MQKFSLNPLFLKDFYKADHNSQYPIGLELLYSNFTPRSDKLAQKLDGIYEGKVVVAGFQGFCKSILIEMFNENFFNKTKEEVVQEYKSVVDEALVTDMDCSHIEELHDLGYLPVKIKTLPEGSLVPVKVPVLTIQNTHPKFAWLVNYLETLLSASNWKAINTATIAWQYRKLLQNFAIKTGSPLDFVMWQGHDFAFRGQSGWQDAMTSSVGHQFSFFGTDTIPVIPYMKHYYGDKTTFVGGSVPASEHSVASANIAAIVSKLEREGFVVPEGSNIKLEAEKIFFGRYISEIYPSGVCSYVADTYNFWDVITEVAIANKDKILNRTENILGLSKVVFRPDSGDPVKIICGYKIWDSDVGITKSPYDIHDQGYEVIRSNGKYYLIDFEFDYYGNDGPYFSHYNLGKQIRKEEAEGAIQTLWNIFGGTLTSTGHKLLNSKVGLIYGDSITLKRAQQILETLEENNFASANVVFGIGSFTYQYNTRDSFGMAMKATYCEVDGEPLELFKDPVTDSGTKKSAKGLLRVEKIAGEYKLFDQQTPEQEAQGELKVIFENSQMLVDETLDTIRQRINESL
jgi:nicotinamide phosphoribosyltransferase